jgi:hypothetical protein
LFYEYFFGVYGFNTMLVQGVNSLSIVQSAVFGSEITYNILILLCGVLVGVLVYALLEGIRLAAEQTSTTWRQLHLPGSEYSRAAHQNLVRLVVLIAALVGWASYMAVFASVLLPTALVLVRAGTENLNFGMLGGGTQIAQSFALLFICLHVQVVFARLTLLRPRIFGWSDIY